MARLCERPGCSQPAEVMYGIDADHLVVWIESRDGAVSYRAGVLCRRHADAMVVPLGWMLDDRREATPRLFRPREPMAVPAARIRRHRSHVARDETGQLELPAIDPGGATADDDGAPTPSAAAIAVAAADGDAEPAPWRPVFDQTDDLDGLLTAQSPLLSRAFGRRDRPSTP